MHIIEHIEIGKLSLLEHNPRKITKEQMQKLCESIKNDPGFMTARPLLVNRIGDLMTVYAGNQRLRACESLGWKKVPCIIEDNLSESLVKDRTIKDNKTYGEFDYDLLASQYEITSLLDAGFSAEELGFDLGALDETPKQEEDKKCKTCPECGCKL